MKYIVARVPNNNAVHISDSLPEAIKWVQSAALQRDMKNCRIMPWDVWLQKTLSRPRYRSAPTAMQDSKKKDAN